MCTSCGQSAPLTLRAGARRRQPERLLGELGRDRGRAAIHGEPCGSSSSRATAASGVSVESAR